MTKLGNTKWRNSLKEITRDSDQKKKIKNGKKLLFFKKFNKNSSYISLKNF